MLTRRDVLRSSIAYALRKVRIADRRGRLLTEEERYAIADQVVELLRLYGDRWKLDEEVPPFMSR